jgi:hypothetical protein
MVVISTELGNISKRLVLSLTHASHTPLVVEMPPHAEQPVLTEKHLKNILAKMLSQRPQFQQLRMKSSRTDPWKPDSTYTLTSSTTRVVFMYTLLVLLKVVTPLKYSVGEQKTELTIGSVLTLGVPAGEKKVSSESSKVNAESTLPSTLATQRPTEVGWYHNIDIS